MKTLYFFHYLFLFTFLFSIVLTGCKEESVTPQNPANTGNSTNTNTSSGNQENTTVPHFSGDLNALFVGHSTMNFIVDDYVKLMAEEADNETSIDIATVTASGGLSLESKYEVEGVKELFTEDASENYDFIVLTEQWDYQFYTPATGGSDTNDPVYGCPPSDYTPPALWTSPPDDWFPTPYALQRYSDAIACGNSSTFTYYYQTWSLGYNEVTNGDTRQSNQNYVRPTVDEIRQLQANGQGMPDLPLADRIDFEGVKWESFVKAANRPDIIFIPAGYAMARLIRDMEAGAVPGFESVATSNGLADNGKLAWTNHLFYQDQYHLSSFGHYFVSLVIYASVFNRSPEGLEVGTDRYLVSEAFPENEYPLQGISNARYQELLDESDAKGIYDLKGYNDLDYIHDDLRIYLQKMVWEVVQQESDY